MELNSYVIIRFEILLWLSVYESFLGPSRNGPQVRADPPAEVRRWLVGA